MSNTYAFSQSKDVKDIEKQLNEDFENICDFIVDNKLQKQHSKVFYNFILQNSQQKNFVGVFFK